MTIKATQLRQNLYKLLDNILETGQPLEIERNGKILRIAPTEPTSKFDLLEKHNTIRGKPEDLLGLDWSELWSESRPKRKKIART
jgi:hypothetical protein